MSAAVDTCIVPPLLLPEGWQRNWLIALDASRQV